MGLRTYNFHFFVSEYLHRQGLTVRKTDLSLGGGDWGGGMSKGKLVDLYLSEGRSKNAVLQSQASLCELARQNLCTVSQKWVFFNVM